MNGLWDQATSLFVSAFDFSGLDWTLILLSIGLALGFGAVWLSPYRPTLFRTPWLWAVGVISAFLTWTAVAFIQLPLQQWWWDLLDLFWPPLVVNHWLLLSAVPYILLSGIVQEGFKLAPVLLYRHRFPGSFDLRTGIIAGAVAGAGFGIFEAVWVHNTIFASGWTWATVDTYGFDALWGFWERFFSVGFHIGVSALAGYGLARGWGWRFYFLAAFIHGLSNYSIILLQRRIITSMELEIYIAVLAVILTGAMLWLRWRKETVPEPEIV